MVQSEQLLQFHYLHLLNDLEIFTAMLYCNKLLKKIDEESIIEFNDLSSYFFNGDNETAIKTLQKISKGYQDEYFKRHQN